MWHSPFMRPCRRQGVAQAPRVTGPIDGRRMRCLYNDKVSRTLIFNLALKALGPAMLGVATIFLGKANPNDHWSTSPTITIQTVAPSDESSGPPDHNTVHSMSHI